MLLAWAQLHSAPGIENQPDHMRCSYKHGGRDELFPQSARAAARSAFAKRYSWAPEVFRLERDFDTLGGLHEHAGFP